MESRAAHTHPKNTPVPPPGFLSCCIVYRCVLLFSFSRCSATFCLPVLTSGPFFQCEALFLHLCLRRWPLCFVEVLSSCCIKALSLFFILRLRPHILYWGFGLVLYWGFVLIFYFEASASYFIWGFVLIFYFEASSSYYIEALSSYFILGLRPHILYWVFVLIILYWGYVPKFEALVLIVLGPCSFVCTAYLIGLQWYVCGSVCCSFV